MPRLSLAVHLRSQGHRFMCCCYLELASLHVMHSLGLQSKRNSTTLHARSGKPHESESSSVMFLLTYTYMHVVILLTYICMPSCTNLQQAAFFHSKACFCTGIPNAAECRTVEPGQQQHVAEEGQKSLKGRVQDRGVTTAARQCLHAGSLSACQQPSAGVVSCRASRHWQ